MLFIPLLIALQNSPPPAATSQPSSLERTSTRDSECKSYPRGFRPTPGKSYCVLPLATPIHEQEWQQYEQVLGASEEQHSAFGAMYERYRCEDWDFRLKHTQPLWERSAEISARRDSCTNVVSAHEMAQLIKDCEQVVPQLATIENRFFDQVQTFLCKDQLIRLESVRRQRTRACSSGLGSTFPASEMDLELVLWVLNHQGVDVMLRDSIAFARSIEQYSEIVTPLFKQRCQVGLRNGMAGMILIAQASELLQSGSDTEVRRNEIRDEYFELNRATMRSARRIHDVNKEYVNVLAEQLSPNAAVALRRFFQETAYPVVFPDPFELNTMFARVSEISTLTSEQRKSIEDLLNAHNAIIDPLIESMVNLYLSWAEETAVRSGYTVEGYEKYKQEMQKLQRQRRSATETMNTTLLEILLPDQVEEIKLTIEQRRQSIAKYDAHLAKLASTNQDWPQPYD